MFRLTPELAKQTMETFGFRLRHGVYGLRNSVSYNRYGCARTLLILASTQDVAKSVELVYCWYSTIAEAIGSHPNYIEGLEAGFEGFPEEIPENDKAFKMGLVDGEKLRSLAEDDHDYD